MEHEVFVPIPAERLRRALADPARVARAVPGLQQDAGAEPLTGRLKLRVGGHSITYRGTARVTPRDDGTYAAEGEATESRGSGSVTFGLTVRLRDTDGGTALTLAGTASADGRLTELPRDAVTSAVLRLLERCAQNLAEESAAAPGPATPADPAPESGTPAEDTPGAPHTSVFDAEVPPPSLDPEADDDTDAPEADHDPDAPEQQDEHDGGSAAPAARPGGRVDPAQHPEDVAEAAHARRTMIGRSAEEVDHAPPRGRYAPVPAPQSLVGQHPLRWAAPAAAVVLASAIVVGRVLRKRR